MDKNIIITNKMREEAYFVYTQNHARVNADYPIAIEIYKQVYDDNDIPFAWNMPEYIMKKAEKINNILFKEFLYN